jgi:hypothetical protein
VLGLRASSAAGLTRRGHGGYLVGFIEGVVGACDRRRDGRPLAVFAVFVLVPRCARPASSAALSSRRSEVSGCERYPAEQRAGA